MQGRYGHSRMYCYRWAFHFQPLKFAEPFSSQTFSNCPLRDVIRKNRFVCARFLDLVCQTFQANKDQGKATV